MMVICDGIAIVQYNRRISGILSTLLQNKYDATSIDLCNRLLKRTEDNSLHTV